MAAIAPDGDPEEVHLSAEVTRTFKTYLAEMEAPDAMPLNMVPCVGSAANANINYAPWQHDYMIMAVDCAANAGFKDAETLLTRLLDFSMGRFTNAPDFDPHKGCGYWWDIVDVGKGLNVKTWKDLAAAPGTSTVPPESDNAGWYSDLALAAAAIGIRTGHPKAKAAYDFLVANTKNVFPQRPNFPCYAHATEPVK